MAFYYDINKIFAELEQQARSQRKKREENDPSKENNPIESPKDAPKTKEVAPAVSKTTEDIHGGDEASKEIEDSPNSAAGGGIAENQNKSGRTSLNGEKGKNGHGNAKKTEDKFNQNPGQIKENLRKGNKPNKDREKSYVIDNGKNNNGKNPSASKPKTTPENLQKVVEKIFEEKEKKKENFRKQNKQEYLKRHILEVIKKVAAKHSGIGKQDGVETYDKKQMLNHMIKCQNYKLLSDKYDLKDARYVQFFIDVSGIYNCGSNRLINEMMPEIINILEKQGYECYIAACGNGFYERDMVEDNYYQTRKTLESYKAGKVSKIACPTPKTAAKMANEAEFSVILADFDGLSSICEMADLCQENKVPYFLCTEDRYPWEDPTFHDWVNPDLCYYNPELVYDVSLKGNPTLEQYQLENSDELEYDENDDREYND